MNYNNQTNQTFGWGKVDNAGAEIWDAQPVFLGKQVGFKDKLKLLFYPKKFFLYHAIQRALSKNPTRRPFRILDVGCGTGATLIDLKKMFGNQVEVVGVDVVWKQIEMAQEKIKQQGVKAEAQFYDGSKLSFADGYFDAIYTSDVLGHVQDVSLWLQELNRVLRPGGLLAMFSESKLGKHAYIRNYLFKRGLNIDPHAEFHISLYSKAELKEKLTSAGFEINKMLGVFWASFLVHPDEFYHRLNDPDQHRFLVLRTINRLLTFIKMKTRPVSIALAELYGLVEALLIGRWVEAQGYIIISSKSYMRSPAERQADLYERPAFRLDS